MTNIQNVKNNLFYLLSVKLLQTITIKRLKKYFETNRHPLYFYIATE